MECKSLKEANFYKASVFSQSSLAPAYIKYFSYQIKDKINLGLIFVILFGIKLMLQQLSWYAEFFFFLLDHLLMVSFILFNSTHVFSSLYLIGTLYF